MNSRALRRLRMQHGCSRQQLAERAGFAHTTIRSMEASGSQAATIKKVADALGVEVAALLDDDSGDAELEAVAS